jgi:hypothetical protein
MGPPNGRASLRGERKGGKKRTMDLLLQIEDALERCTTWTIVPTDTSPDPTAKAYAGEHAGWGFLVISYASEAYPAGRGYHGTAAHVGGVVRFTRALAEKAYKLAEKDEL